MTEFNFSHNKKPLVSGGFSNGEVEVGVKIQPTRKGNLNIKIPEINFSLHARLYSILSKHINYLNERNLIPELKDPVTISFISADFVENYKNKTRKNFPSEYGNLACSFPSESKICISASLLTHKNYINHVVNFSEAFDVFKQEFGSDHHKALEKEFMHELAHIIANKKFKPVDSKDDGFRQHLKLNIEEAFCETFSLHMMAIKYPEQSMKNLQNWTKSRAELDEADQNYSVLGVATYNISRVYDSIPLKDTAGKIVYQVDEIISKSFEVALSNNREILLEKMQDSNVKKSYAKHMGISSNK